jgi:hypothetical protein
MTPEWMEEFSAVVPMEDVMMTDDPPPTVPADELALWFVCDDALAKRKVDALRCQASQVGGFIEMAGMEVYERLNRDEMYREATADDWPE